jgi:hypothetical protein
MDSALLAPDPPIHRSDLEHGDVRLELLVDQQPISTVAIQRHSVRYGCTILPLASIGSVWTDERYRRRGFARCLLEHALQQMHQWPIGLSMLHGIPGFYPKFGYTTVAPLWDLHLTAVGQPVDMPQGWQMRPARSEDLPAIRALYDRNTAEAYGAGVRPADSAVWIHLCAALAGDASTDCRIVLDSTQQLHGYAWLGKGFPYPTEGQGYWPTALLVAEAMADSPLAADALIAVCYAWAHEEARIREQGLDRILVCVPPESLVARAARLHEACANAYSFRDSGAMARIIDLPQLMLVLQPELQRALRATGYTERMNLHIQTEVGEVWLKINADSITMTPAPSDAAREAVARQEWRTVVLPQTALTRLILGMLPAEDIVSRLPQPVEKEIAQLLGLLFPQRTFHTYPIDRP